MNEEPTQFEVMEMAREVLDPTTPISGERMFEIAPHLAQAVLDIASRAHESDISLIRIRQILDGKVVSLITREGSG